ncbi:exosporium protein C [Paenibacillus sp. KQZ6P-2]|uniref:Exosporium protein C n=1 Tax=Paenibacillus mangrovi TaxID=2931978 RepID=A0A9X2B730_9BACL|nr:exosporium protein C [Paenibacillus mangrovi]MCJ8013323.1 exosporium protein C [Paenibacillus mangrovi]
MARILDKAAVQSLSSFNPAKSFTIRRSPQKSGIASIPIRIPVNSQPNRVDLVASVGVRGVKGIGQIRFRVFRGGTEIFNTQQGIESSGSEQNYVVTFQAEDFNVKAGTHAYTVTAENLAANTRVDVVGPITFSGLAVKVRPLNLKKKRLTKHS